MNAITPNSLASLALFLWPLVCLFFYRTKPLVPATLWTLLAGELFLPVGTFFKIEMIPQLDKTSIPNLCALVGCALIARRPIQLFNRFGITELAICVYLISPVLTSWLNQDAFQIGTTIIPGVGIYDGISALISQFIGLIPFFLGRQFFKTTKDAYQIMRVLAIAGLVYSIPLLFEIRFSPQLHFWLYGYYPSDFIQEIREGGFRPMAFMGHGLLASFFLMTTAVASAALWRINHKLFKINAGGLTGYLSLVLYLCKSGAATVYGLILVPLARWGSPKVQMNVALCLAILALSYPLLRISEVFPTSTLVTSATVLSQDRALSLSFRFDQEETLLNRASERFWFGWGRYGRSRVYKEDWQGAAIDTSVTDGFWIISFGQFGIVGFLAEFFLLATPIFRAVKPIKLVFSKSSAPLLSTTALILGINLVDLLPNSTLSPWTWVLAGSLLGMTENTIFAYRHGRAALSLPASK